MYRAFKITVDYSLESMLKQQCYSRGLSTFFDSNMQGQSMTSLKSKLQKMIRKSSLTTETLYADSIWDEWFPNVNADVFISHSSKDADLAKSFASWLKQNHQLTAFIDSEIWGHSDALLKELDDEYCLNHGGETYSYDKRNGSTAHVHMMLSYSLTRMIDRTECFIFLESHNSATARESVNGTYSPWIFHELATVDTIELNPPTRLMEEVVSRKHEAIYESYNLKIKYPLLGRRLIQMDENDLSAWETKKRQSNAHSLDLLYQEVPNS